MWGVSLGGKVTMIWMPLEPRIKAGVVSAWFNQRRNKMVIPDDRYTSFLVTTEDHAFFTGWLSEFTDHDVVSLICPRPLLIQHGKQDRIAHWPQVLEEYEIAKTHYEKLNITDRIQIDMHESGHEAIIESGEALHATPPPIYTPAILLLYSASAASRRSLEVVSPGTLCEG
jgi:hypothetical protein